MRPEPYEAVTESLGREVEAQKARIEALERKTDSLIDVAVSMSEMLHILLKHPSDWKDCVWTSCSDVRNLTKETP